jgi:hypothetical protein
VLEAILESNGLVLVQTGPVAQVLPEARRPATGPLRYRHRASHPAPARPRDADRAAREHAGRGGRAAAAADGGAVGAGGRGAALQLADHHRPRRQDRGLPRPAPPARREDRRRSRAAHLRVPPQARERGGAGEPVEPAVRALRAGGHRAHARPLARGPQPVGQPRVVPPARERSLEQRRRTRSRSSPRSPRRPGRRRGPRRGRRRRGRSSGRRASSRTRPPTRS